MNPLDQDRKQQIIEVSTKLFYEQGYDFTSTRELAKAANLSVAGLYYFFKDKEEILFNVLNNSVTNLLKVLESAINLNEDPIENIKRYIHNMVTYVLESRMAIIVMMREDLRLSTSQIEIVNIKRREAFQLIYNELVRFKETKTAKNLDPIATAFSLIGMTNWVVFWYDPARKLSVDDIVKQITEIFFTGIISDEK